MSDAEHPAIQCASHPGAPVAEIRHEGGIYYVDCLACLQERAAIPLDDYETANLAAALRAIAGHYSDGTFDWSTDDWRSPLQALNTGDWVCQILAKLRPTLHAPNKTPEQARADARAYGRIDAQAEVKRATDQVKARAHAILCGCSSGQDCGAPEFRVAD